MQKAVARSISLYCCFVLATAVFAAGGDDEGMATEPQLLDNCKKVTTGGAEELQVKIDSNTKVALQGVKKGRVIWSKPFPLKEEINSAKTTATCDGSLIELDSQSPFSSYTTSYKFSFDGAKLKFVSASSSDSSQEALEDYVHAAESGDKAIVDSGPDTIMYPGHYVHAESIGNLIKRGHNAALKLFRAKKIAEAQQRIKLTFQAAVQLAELNYPIEGPSADPATWMKLFNYSDLALDKSIYVPALNDYGFFLQESKQNQAAVAIFEKVLKQDPSRAVAYLNLADSLWTLGKTKDAKNAYGQYKSALARDKKLASTTIPPRVDQRLKQ